jgi:ABC-type transporter Mla maintaining outer membrane lipid asymmetry ATPase subunit MlaF
MNISVFDRALDTGVRFSSAGSAVSLRGITKAFGKQKVLHGIDLDIPAGQFVAIVGRSGCGKSTLLRLIAGLDQPTGGTIEIDGQAPGWRDSVRLMFQEPRLLPWQRVAANVEIGLSHAPSGDDRRRQAIEAIDQVGLSGREKEWPGRQIFSPGHGRTWSGCRDFGRLAMLVSGGRHSIYLYAGLAPANALPTF